MKQRYLQYQRGHAAILFILMFPALFSLFALATDGARAMQDKARLNDALEAASLAISAHNDENNESGSDGSGAGSSIIGSGSDVNKQIVEAYVNQYMTDMDSIVAINIEREECNSDPESDTCTYSSSSTNPAFFQYKVYAKTDHSTWFNDSSAFGDSFQVSSGSTSRKYQNQSVDVVFVSDFSSSMGYTWVMDIGEGESCSDYSDYGSYTSGSSCVAKKYKGVIAVIKSIVETLDEYNSYQTTEKNTAAFVPYNKMMQKNQSRECDFLQYNYNAYGHKTSINYTATVENVFTNSGDCNYKGRNYKLVIPDDEEPLMNGLYNKIKNFSPGGYTASFQGIIKGAQVLKSTTNKKKLMVILSDGDDKGGFVTTSDTESATIAETLYGSTYDLCGTIRNTLDNDEDVESKITVIGFGYDVSSNIGLQLCAAAGGGEVFEAENFDEVRTQILKLIVEEIGHLK